MDVKHIINVYLDWDEFYNIFSSYLEDSLGLPVADIKLSQQSEDGVTLVVTPEETEP